MGTGEPSVVVALVFVIPTRRDDSQGILIVILRVRKK